MIHDNLKVYTFHIFRLTHTRVNMTYIPDHTHSCAHLHDTILHHAERFGARRIRLVHRAPHGVISILARLQSMQHLRLYMTHGHGFIMCPWGMCPCVARGIAGEAFERSSKRDRLSLWDVCGDVAEYGHYTSDQAVTAQHVRSATLCRHSETSQNEMQAFGMHLLLSTSSQDSVLVCLRGVL